MLPALGQPGDCFAHLNGPDGSRSQGTCPGHVGASSPGAPSHIPGGRLHVSLDSKGPHTPGPGPGSRVLPGEVCAHAMRSAVSTWSRVRTPCRPRSEMPLCWGSRKDSGQAGERQFDPPRPEFIPLGWSPVPALRLPVSASTGQAALGPGVGFELTSSAANLPQERGLFLASAQR